MSGHSHWAGIKHRKGINDAKRAKIFTKAAKLITIAAQTGGGKPDTNFTLRLAIDQSRTVNMPKDNIERAIKRGTGELKEGTTIEEVVYEAYGPGQVAMLIKAATDNKNRALGEIKTILSKNGGKIVPAGSVGFMFSQLGSVEIKIPPEADLGELEMKAIEAGAEDTFCADDRLTIYTLIDNLQKVEENIKQGGLEIENAGLVFVPTQRIKISSEDRTNYEKILDLLDDQDDVQGIYDNL